MPRLKAEPDFLRSFSAGSPGIGVDREAGVLRGMVVAEVGPFKTPGRGEFDAQSLNEILAAMQSQPGGVRSRFAHPTLSADGLGKYLGRVKDPRLDTVTLQRDGKPVDVQAIRGDLHFNPTAFKAPPGGGRPLAEYVMELAATDPGAFSSSLVVKAEKKPQLDPLSGKPATDAAGKPRPPLWRVLAVRASDVVDTGDAVHGILSALSAGDGDLDLESLPPDLLRGGAVRYASELLDAAFPVDVPREVAEKRIRAWVDRYLSLRYDDGAEEGPQTRADELAAALTGEASGPSIASRRRRLALLRAR